MAFITVSNTFTNSTTADASQVNTNFTDLINGTSDGTKDFSIAALTLSSTFTANGNVTLGNASSDDVTITGSLAATLPIKTNTSFDFGSATLGLRYLYLGGTSTFTGRLGVETLAASRVYTLPEIGGDVTVQTSQAIQSITTGTTTLTTANKTILCDTSGGTITLNLPAVSGRSGQYLVIKKTTNDLNVITIDGNASETIDGATTKKLNTYNEMVRLETNGSAWYVTGRKNDTPFVSYTPTLKGQSNGLEFSNQTTRGWWRKVGDSVQIQITTLFSGTPATATGYMFWSLPTSITPNTSKMDDSGNENVLGVCKIYDATSSYQLGSISYDSVSGGFVVTGSNSNALSATVPITFAINDIINLEIFMPVTNWED
jgi:hypothetical protein